MPNGHWVAFNHRISQVHECVKEAPKKRRKIVQPKCQYCGKSIEMRKVPSGLIVAFDLGTNKIHDYYESSRE